MASFRAVSVLMCTYAGSMQHKVGRTAREHDGQLMTEIRFAQKEPGLYLCRGCFEMVGPSMAETSGQVLACRCSCHTHQHLHLSMLVTGTQHL